jgi:hypothetical protein
MNTSADVTLVILFTPARQRNRYFHRTRMDVLGISLGRVSSVHPESHLSRPPFADGLMVFCEKIWKRGKGVIDDAVSPFMYYKYRHRRRF